MVSPNKKRDTGCPIAFALDTFGDRWSLIIVRDMVMRGYSTYSEFLNCQEKIASNILSKNLKELEADGIISKNKDPHNGRQYIYRLTNKGADLIPVILEMITWSSKYDTNTLVRK